MSITVGVAVAVVPVLAIARKNDIIVFGARLLSRVTQKVLAFFVLLEGPIT